jgi:hypothetical protein
MRRAAILLAWLPLLAACELREITLATPDDVVIAEVVLRAASSLQTAYLHRTSSDRGTARVFGAHVEVTEHGTGRSFVLMAEADSLCLEPAPEPGDQSVGTCYAANASVQPGLRYDLRIQLDGGGVLTGTTVVPGSFSMLTPAEAACALPPDSQFELRWTRSEGASVYLTEARLWGLRQALRGRGLDVPGTAPVELLGLSITAEDTTLVFPAELGLFDRFEEDLHPILVALQGGVPPGVATELTIAAADRNYVNWVRGGTFNPSGAVRVSSLRGDGAGMFGALVTRSLEIRTGMPGQQLPPCR